ncbi:MAG: RelA/SpoT family protein [Clostridia bacterium]
MENTKTQAKMIALAEKTLIECCGHLSIVRTEAALKIIRETKLDEECEISALLYFPFSHNHITKEYIASAFSTEILTMVESLEKLHKVEYNNKEEEAENIRKMFFALTKDIRVIFVRLAFAEAEIDNITLFDKSKQKERAKVVLDIFAPLAARLGASNIKTSLENSAFKIIYPEKYNEIEKSVEEKFKGTNNIIAALKDYLTKTINSLGIDGEIMGRKKHIYSIYKKMMSKGSALDEIYDLIALRVLVHNLPECYSVLGKIQEELTPLPGRFKDYIATPKSNGYQSLHTTVLYNSLPVEIQIRTFDMHKSAEFGITAHWMYKEKRTKMDSLDTKLGWIRQMIDESSSMTSEEVVENFKVDIYDGEIFVQSPMGKVVHLPEKSTPIDFAYCIHSDIGNKCTGAKVNGKMVPLTSSLNNGDIVEIVTSNASKGPSRDWLKIVKTFSAKSKIKAFFKKGMKEENFKIGKNMLELAAKNQGFSFSSLCKTEWVGAIIKKYSLTDIDELFASVGNGSISANIIVNKFILQYKNEQKQKQKIAELPISKKQTNDGASSILIQGADNMLIKFAPCCNPIPGDEIVGFISQGRGLIVHRKTCQNVKYYHPERLMDVSWQRLGEGQFEASISIETSKKLSVLPLVTSLLGELKIALRSLNVLPYEKGKDLIQLTVAIKNQTELSSLISALENKSGIIKAYRNN